MTLRTSISRVSVLAGAPTARGQVIFLANGELSSAWEMEARRNQTGGEVRPPAPRHLRNDLDNPSVGLLGDRTTSFDKSHTKILAALGHSMCDR